MSKSRLQQRVITLASVRSLDCISKSSVTAEFKKYGSNNNNNNSNKIVWKEFGVYLDKKVETRVNPDKFIDNKENRGIFVDNSIPDVSYLQTNIKYKICTSCQRPIGEASLKSHYKKCLEMRQKKKANVAANTASHHASTANDDNDSTTTNTSTKQMKRKRKHLLDDGDISSVNSSRNSTPFSDSVPVTESPAPSASSASTSTATRPKKKYKKSQTQKEKEAANAAAAAAARAAAAANAAANLSQTPTKKKKPAKPKPPSKVKGPVDVERQCGVALPGGGFCARSLTCKTHSMGAKRAVLGRSAPYDVLLQQYQKMNQAKIAATNALAIQRRENAAFHSGDGSNGHTFNKVLDPDEETHLVLEGLSKNNPMPLERKIIMPMRYRHRFLNRREAYANALITSGSTSSNSNSANSDSTLATQAISGSIGGLQGRCALINVDAPSQNPDCETQAYSTISGEMYQVRAPSRAIILSAQFNNQQQKQFQEQMLKLQEQQQQQQQQMLAMRKLQAQRAQAAAAATNQAPSGESLKTTGQRVQASLISN